MKQSETTRENYDDYNRTAEAGKCEDEDETLWYSHASKKPSAPDQIDDDAQDSDDQRPSTPNRIIKQIEMHRYDHTACVSDHPRLQRC